MKQIAFDHGEEIFVDLFAGGGGASEGAAQALGRAPHIAINHDPEAIALHDVNHPRTEHYRADVFEVSPLEATRGRAVGGLWLSPDCTHHSRARGGVPFRDPEASAGRRALADVGIVWAEQTRPRVIFLENVTDWLSWGPIDPVTKKPIPELKGTLFREWVGKLEALGYVVEWRKLRACDFGAPTTRERLFLVARCDGLPIVWPEPTHGPGLLPFRTAAECIDFSNRGQSIFGRKKPLAEKTLARIARGIQKFILDAADPFIVPANENAGPSAPTLVHSGNGERPGQAPRIYDIRQPLGTVMAGGQKHALITAVLAKHYGGHEGPNADLRAPLPTVTTRGQLGVVFAFLAKYYGTGTGQDLRTPLGSPTTKDRFQLVLVTINGETYELIDITHRMLQPRELFTAMGVRRDYVIDRGPGGKRLTRTSQIRLCGNMVCPDMSRVLVAANLRGAPAERRAA